jgi:KaiC/GvpD/RAD55 family RecA-like ATPase
MSSAVRLPSELREFLALPGPQTLLIRGPPGAGKSTLSLAILEAAAGTRILVSSRVSQTELQREFPWMGGATSQPVEIVDASSVESPFPGGMSEGIAATVLSDGPLEEHEPLQEFLLLPSPVQDAWSRLPNDGRACVVIDSWDALVEQYLGRRHRHGSEALDRAEVERMLLRRMGRSSAHLVLVLERDSESQLDYLVNGVIVARREIARDRLERWLWIPKLRGIRVANSGYPYTVEGGRFQCIEPLRAFDDLQTRSFDPDPTPSVPGLWPGSLSLADGFGRWPLGKMSALEPDEEIPESVLLHLVGPAMRHTLSRGGRVLVVPSPSLSFDELWGSVEGAVDPAVLAANFRVVDVSRELATRLGAAHPALRDTILAPDNVIGPVAASDQSTPPISAWLKEDGGSHAPGLVILYISGLESLAASLRVAISPEVAAAFPASVQSTLGGGNLHLVAVGHSEAPLFRPMRSLAALRIEVRTRLGRVFLYGTKPWTPGFVLTESTSAGPFDLLRIV